MLQNVGGEITRTMTVQMHAAFKTATVVSALPKTRSGKIMRRILRKIAEGDVDEMGDTSTLADPSVVDALVEGRK